MFRLRKSPPVQYKRAAALLSFLLSIQLALHFAENIVFLLVSLPLFGLIYFIFCHEYFDNSQEISISICHKRTGILQCWLISFSIMLFGQMLFWGAFFPGGFNLDALNQWYQIHGELPVSNWHSPLVTFFYWTITRLSDSLSVCIAVQLVLFSSAAALLISELYRQYISQRMAAVVSILMALNPAIGRINVSLVKDIYFSIILLLMYFVLLRVIGTNGYILRSKLTILASSFLLTALILVRHNGILMTAAIILALLIYYKKYRPFVVRILFISSLLTILIEGPIYRTFNVAPHANIVGESVGVPMAIMVNALVNDPDNIPDDAKDFLHSIEPNDSAWKNSYVIGEWDSCKWTIGDNTGDGMLLSSTPLTKIIVLIAKTAIACPNASYQSFRENTRIIWQAIGSCNWLPFVFQEENPYQIIYRPVASLSSIEANYFSLFSTGPLGIYHWNTGLQISVLLLLFLRCVKRGSVTTGILIFPLLLYNIGTSLIIAGPNYRYFYCNAVLFVPLILYLFCAKQQDPEPVRMSNHRNQ